MPFQIEYSLKAFEQLKKLDKPARTQIFKRLEKLAENPELAKTLSNVFKNYRSERIGKFRVIFSIRKKTLLIAKIGHRKTVYR